MSNSTVPVPVNASARELFIGFCLIGLSGFGGVLPFARREIVERRNWLAPAEFNELLGICQIMPGPNVINLSVLLGARHAGVRGALAAPAGLLLAPMLIMLALGLLWRRFNDLPALTGALHGVAAAGAGLILGAGVKMLMAYKKTAPGGALARPQSGWNFSALALAAAAFVAIALLRWPLAPVTLTLLPVGAWLAWRKK